jgi:hypothetical protein
MPVIPADGTWIQGQPQLHKEAMSQKKKKNWTRFPILQFISPIYQIQICFLRNFSMKRLNLELTISIFVVKISDLENDLVFWFLVEFKFPSVVWICPVV